MKNMDDKQVRESSAFDRAVKFAAKIAGKASTALAYIGKASGKLRLLEMAGKNWDTIKQDFKDLLALLTAYYNGSYKKVPLATVTKALVGVIYLVFIFDFIPDFIPFIGFMDDIAVIGWILNSVTKDIEEFRTWRNALNTDVQNEEEGSKRA